jgi:hypothetical protein
MTLLSGMGAMIAAKIQCIIIFLAMMPWLGVMDAIGTLNGSHSGMRVLEQ